jgi:hypothetical protein
MIGSIGHFKKICKLGRNFESMPKNDSGARTVVKQLDSVQAMK